MRFKNEIKIDFKVYTSSWGSLFYQIFVNRRMEGEFLGRVISFGDISSYYEGLYTT
jgi:hypothetical protein